MPKPRLAFYIDPHSTYTYIAYHYIRHSEIFKQCDITYVPVLIIGFVKAGVSVAPWGNKSMAFVAPATSQIELSEWKANWVNADKTDYSSNDIARWARLFDIPWKAGYPENYPLTRTQDLQRAMVACTQLCPDKVGDVYDAIMHAFWCEKKGMQLPENFEPVLKSVLGDELADKVIQRGREEETRTALRKNTERAVAEGACGLPWLVAYNDKGERDTFWGFDHLGLVARHLGLGKLPAPHL